MSESTLNRHVAANARDTSPRKRAVLYLRVSTPGQVHTDYDPEGNSIPAQRAAGKRKADMLDADVVREFVEPGRSATNIDRRPAFQEMVAWVKQQKTSTTSSFTTSTASSGTASTPVSSSVTCAKSAPEWSRRCSTWVTIPRPP